MSSNNNERTSFAMEINVGTLASSASVVIPGIYFRKHSRIKNVWLADTTGVSKSSSNYLTVTLQDNAGSPVSYAAVATSAAALVAVTPLAMALTTPVGDTANQPEADVPAGTMLNVKVAGTGTAVTTNSKVIVEWYPL